MNVYQIVGSLRRDMPAAPYWRTSDRDSTPQTEISSRSCVIHVWRCNLTEDPFCVLQSLFFLYLSSSSSSSFCSLFIPLPPSLVLASPWLYSETGHILGTGWFQCWYTPFILIAGSPIAKVCLTAFKNRTGVWFTNKKEERNRIA